MGPRAGLRPLENRTVIDTARNRISILRSSIPHPGRYVDASVSRWMFVLPATYACLVRIKSSAAETER